jgi:DNA-binding transcriptional regulator PaaX
MSRKSEIIKDILAIVGSVGIIAIAMTAPNLVQIFGPKYNSARKRYQIKRSLKVMQKMDLVSIAEKNGRTTIRLTKAGKKKVLSFKLDDMQLKKPSIWDKKWRLVIFDIPISHNQARIMFTNKLRELGFEMIQRSVWVSPYECEDEVDFIKEVYEIRPFVRVVTAESIDISNDLIHKFNLEHK